MEVRIKNMVCPRCIKVVREELEKRGGIIGKVELGRAEVCNLTVNEIKEVLGSNGFELLERKETQIVEQIKIEILKIIRGQESIDLRSNLSDVLSGSLNRDYSTLTSLFSSVTGLTIEKYFISQKIEYAKELLIYKELNNSEISRKLGYSSLAHFSNQFKQITGFSPSQFKNQLVVRRSFIDQ